MSQPTVPAEFELLEADYKVGDLSMDLYGERPCSYGGFNVCALTLAGDTRNLFDLVTQAQLNALSNALNATADFEVTS